jgi:hypothetical protein
MVSQEEIEKKLQYVEAMFEKYGAKPLEINEKNREEFDERRAFLYEGNYYRTGTLEFEEHDGPFIVISCIDSEKFAGIGLMEDVDAFAPTLTEPEIEKQVRYALGIEPYPEEYELEK